MPGGPIGSRHTDRQAQRGLSGRPLGPLRAGRTVSGERGDGAVRADHAHPVVVAIGDVDPAGAVDGNGDRFLEGRLRRRTPVPSEASVLAPSHGRDHSFLIHLAHAVVQVIGDVESAGGVDCEAPRMGETRVPCGTAITFETVEHWLAGKVGDRAGFADAQDAAVGRIRDEDRSVRGNGDAVYIDIGEVTRLAGWHRRAGPRGFALSPGIRPSPR